MGVAQTAIIAVGGFSVGCAPKPGADCELRAADRGIGGPRYLLKRELPRIPLVGKKQILHSAQNDKTLAGCHSEESRFDRGDEESAGAFRKRPTADPSASPQDDKKGGAQGDKGVFWAFAKAGKELADLHINYEK